MKDEPLTVTDSNKTKIIECKNGPIVVENKYFKFFEIPHESDTLDFSCLEFCTKEGFLGIIDLFDNIMKIEELTLFSETFKKRTIFKCYNEFIIKYDTDPEISNIILILNFINCETILNYLIENEIIPSLLNDRYKTTVENINLLRIDELNGGDIIEKIFMGADGSLYNNIKKNYPNLSEFVDRFRKIPQKICEIHKTEEFPLYILIKDNEIEAIKYALKNLSILENYHPNRRCNFKLSCFGDTVDVKEGSAFFYALCLKKFEICDLLLEFDRSTINEISQTPIGSSYVYRGAPLKTTLMCDLIIYLSNIDLHEHDPIHNSEPRINYLLKNGADINIPNDLSKNEFPPIFYALIGFDTSQIFRYLTKLGADKSNLMKMLEIANDRNIMTRRELFRIMGILI